jgi:hypothetical protein
MLVFGIVLAAAYPNARVTLLNHFLIYAVTILCVVSSFDYSIVTARRLSSSSSAS